MKSTFHAKSSCCSAVGCAKSAVRTAGPDHRGPGIRRRHSAAASPPCRSTPSSSMPSVRTSADAVSLAARRCSAAAPISRSTGAAQPQPGSARVSACVTYTHRSSTAGAASSARHSTTRSRTSAMCAPSSKPWGSDDCRTSRSATIPSGMSAAAARCRRTSPSCRRTAYRHASHVHRQSSGSCAAACASRRVACASARVSARHRSSGGRWCCCACACRTHRNGTTAASSHHPPSAEPLAPHRPRTSADLSTDASTVCAMAVPIACRTFRAAARTPGPCSRAGTTVSHGSRSAIRSTASTLSEEEEAASSVATASLYVNAVPPEGDGGAGGGGKKKKKRKPKKKEEKDTNHQPPAGRLPTGGSGSACRRTARSRHAVVKASAAAATLGPVSNSTRMHRARCAGDMAACRAKAASCGGVHPSSRRRDSTPGRAPPVRRPLYFFLILNFEVSVGKSEK